MPDLHDWGTGEVPKPPRSFPADPRPKWHIDPTNLPDLLKRAGPYAEAAKAYVEWGAVTAWHMHGAAKEALAAAFISGAAASLSVLLTRQAIEHETGWPCLSDSAVRPALYDLPEDAQGIARSMAAEVYALWEAAGRPYLNRKACEMTHRYLVACVRKGTIPPVLTIGDVPPRAAPHPNKLPRHP